MRRRAGHLLADAGARESVRQRAARRVGRPAEERVVLLLLDGPAFAYGFFGAIKIGAVPIPLNTLWTPADYGYVLDDSRARVLVVSEALLPQIARIPAVNRPSLRHIVVVANQRAWAISGCDDLLECRIARARRRADEPRRAGVLAVFVGQHGRAQGLRAPAARHGRVRGAVRRRASSASGPRIAASAWRSCSSPTASATRCYFPFSVGATSILWPGAPAPAGVYDVIERHRPTLFFSVPTGYGMLLARTRGSARLRSVERAARRVGRRGAAGRALRALQAALRRRHPRRHRIDRGAAHVHLEPARTPSARARAVCVVPGYEARAARR